MIDLKRYYRLHPKGLCKVERDNDGFVILFKRFDNETGEELSPEPQYVTKESLEKDKNDLSMQMSAMQMILNDIENL